MFRNVSIARRLCSIVYDSILVIAILIIGTFIALAFNKFEPIKSGSVIFQTYLVSLWTLFFVWFWAHGGQTAGMTAWRVKVVDYKNNPISAKVAIKRFFMAFATILFFGIGLIYAFFNKNRDTLYDRISKTKLIFIPKH